jgi:nitroreductase
MGSDTVETVRTVRQIRQYAPDPVPDDVLRTLLRVARWTGSSKNTQPWHFIVITDRALLRRLSQLRSNINWLADVPLAIAVVLDGAAPLSEAYDEGRLAERVLVAANALGYGGGVGFWGDDSQQADAKRMLGIPDERTARSFITIGKAISRDDPRGPRKTGRKPMAEIVSYDRWGNAAAKGA